MLSTLASTLRRGSVTTLTCAGEVDHSTSRKVRDAIDLCMESDPSLLRLDGRRIWTLAGPGIEALLYLAASCRQHGIRLELQLSNSARETLDLEGFWWLGVASAAEIEPLKEAHFGSGAHR